MPQPTPATKEYHRKQYIARINKVIDYIERNLDNELNLELLANVASFSPFHFHRIFTLLKGETLNGFVKRKRLEKAASYLLGSKNMTVTEIAVKCGFSSNAAFSRAFREHFNMSATEFANGGYKQYSKISKLDSNNRKDKEKNRDYLSEKELQMKEKLPLKVRIEDLPEINVAYARHIGEFDQIEHAFRKLFQWAGPRGLLKFPDTKVMTVYHDDPKVTEIHNLQQSACISIDRDTKVEGEIGKMKIAGGKYAMAYFEVTAKQFHEAWQSIAAGWLPESGYECDDRLPFEIFHNDHNKHPENKFFVDICIPVRPL